MPAQSKWTALRRSRLHGVRQTTMCAALLVVLTSSGALFAESPEQQAWKMLKAGMAEKNTSKRAQAVKALRLLPNNPEAAEIARTALKDSKTEVRVAAAISLGLMNSKESVPDLKLALSDCKSAVVLAAAHSLQTMNDPSGYDAYYQLLTGEKKPVEGLIARELGSVNTKTVVEFGVEEGLGFVPFADEGYTAVKVIRKDNASPVRALAARALVKDTDPGVNQTLVHIATSDKSWLVRASALLAIAKRENPELLNSIVPALSDKNRVVRYTAAAAVIRLSGVAARKKDSKKASDPSIHPVQPAVGAYTSAGVRNAKSNLEE